VFWHLFEARSRYPAPTYCRITDAAVSEALAEVRDNQDRLKTYCDVDNSILANGLREIVV
jgi:hypothetical protein